MIPPSSGAGAALERPQRRLQFGQDVVEHPHESATYRRPRRTATHTFKPNEPQDRRPAAYAVREPQRVSGARARGGLRRGVDRRSRPRGGRARDRRGRAADPADRLRGALPARRNRGRAEARVPAARGLVQAARRAQQARSARREADGLVDRERGQPRARGRVRRAGAGRGVHGVHADRRARLEGPRGGAPRRGCAPGGRLGRAGARARRGARARVRGRRSCIRSTTST